MYYVHISIITMESGILQICKGLAGGHWGGGRVPPLTAKKLPKIAKKREKIRKNQGRGKTGKKRQKLGRFFLFAPPDR